jgi:hypothetical protein
VRDPYTPPKARVAGLKQPRTVGEIEGFITLLRAACDNATMSASLEKLLAMPDEKRRALVHSWVSELLTQDVPRNFVEAIACLHDDAVAEKAYEVIFHCRR